MRTLIIMNLRNSRKWLQWMLSCPKDGKIKLYFPYFNGYGTFTEDQIGTGRPKWRRRITNSVHITKGPLGLAWPVRSPLSSRNGLNRGIRRR